VTAPIDILVAFVLGGAVALACRIQLRLSPRPWYATRYFAALSGFLALVYLPAAAYRYFFHPDWSVMYVLDATSTPGILGLLQFVLLFAVATGAFVLGNYSARAHREWLLLTSLSLAVAGIATIAALGVDRIRVVGTFAQWEGNFGLRQLASTDLFGAILLMGAIVLLAWVHLLVFFAREGAAVRSASG
jgi:hypothetical protein